MIRSLLAVGLLASAFSGAVLADGIDPHVIIRKGGGSTPITIQNPNPVVNTPAQTNVGQCFDASSPACVFDVFQNRLGITITSLTVAIPDISGLVFSCDPAAQLFDFNTCTSTDNGKVTDVKFSNSPNSPFSGVPTAVWTCVPNFDGNDDPHGCDKDDYTWVGGEFAVDIEGAGISRGTVVPVGVVPAAEPGAGLLLLVGGLALGALAVSRKAAIA